MHHHLEQASRGSRKPWEAMMVRTLLVMSCVVGCNDKSDDSSNGTPTDDSTPSLEDLDGDGFAVPDDCDDANATISPSATEICDAIDNDCDGTIDVGASDATAYFVDGDGDTYGSGKPTMSCTPIEGSVDNADDCDDADKAINPAAVEVCDPLDTDEDCDKLADEDDDSLDTSTSALTVYIDADGDGYGADGTKIAACDLEAGYSESPGDCDDASSAAHPGAKEVCGDAVDEDCDGLANSCRYSGDVDPADAYAQINGWRFLELGKDITPAGDMNGDGVGDMAVGTRGGSGAFVFAGPVSGTIDAAKAWGEYERPKSGDPIGNDVLGIGDQDGDGYSDLLVSAPNSASNMGRAYIVLGPASGAAPIDEVASATITGNASGIYTSAYPSAGDVNGDGIVDLLVPASGMYTNTGASFFFFGPVTTGDYVIEDADAMIFGVEEYWGLGSQNAANGDIDGDGVDDMLLSAYQADYLDLADGVVYLFYGPVTGTHYADEADAVIYGAPAYQELGWGSSIGGDLDADGLDDVAVSAPFGSDGDLYLFYADAVVGSSELVVSKADATISGDPGSLQQFGDFVDTAGDLDSDGYDDLSVGSREADAANGIAWTYYGPLSGMLEATKNASFVVHGTAGQNLYATAFVDDVTGDGVDDLAIGAPATTVAGDGIAGIVLLFNGTK